MTPLGNMRVVLNSFSKRSVCARCVEQQQQKDVMVRIANTDGADTHSEASSMRSFDLMSRSSDQAIAAQPYPSVDAEPRWPSSEQGVAEAFLTNCAGGAACFDVDFSMVAEGSVTEELTAAFVAMKRSMALADKASWAVASTDSGTATVVASLTSISNIDQQEYVLSIDVTSLRPITAIAVRELKSSSLS